MTPGVRSRGCRKSSSARPLESCCFGAIAWQPRSRRKRDLLRQHLDGSGYYSRDPMNEQPMVEVRQIPSGPAASAIDRMAVELCAGLGGIGIGLRALGFHVAKAYDSWEEAVAIYNHNFGGGVAAT